METQNFWEYLWKLAIQISILLNFPHRLTDDERAAARDELKRIELPGDLQDAISAALDGRFRAHRPPSSILSLLLSSPKSKIEKLRVAAPQVLYDLMIRHVNSACFVFIDSFDQAIEDFLPGNLEAWAAAQRGLLRAAWHISRHNRHVKVYVTIRQEAYASFDGTERLNIKGSILLLRYSKEDMHSLLVKAIHYYEGEMTLEEFVGMPTIFNEYAKRSEKAFDYLYRHLIGVPRWFTYLGGQMSYLPRSRKIDDRSTYNVRLKGVREIVNRVSAELAQDHLCSEMKLFFRGHDPHEMIRKLCSQIHSTVLSYSNVYQLAKFLTDTYGWEHPFSLLYNLGLLGLVQRRPGSQSRFQAFKRPYEFDWSFNNILPEDTEGIYLLHPALHHMMTTINPRCRFSGALVGDGFPWTQKNDAIIRKETIRLFVSYAHEDETLVHEIVETMHRYLNRDLWLFDIWFDAWKMEAGRAVQTQIGQGLTQSDFLIVMVSPNSMKSEFVEMEWKSKLLAPFCDQANGNDRVLPIILGGTFPDETPDIFRKTFGYPYRGTQDEQNIERLVKQMAKALREAA